MIAIRPLDDQVTYPGERFVVERTCPDDPIFILHERTLPECVDRVDARRVTRGVMIALTTPEAIWMHARLGEMLGLFLAFMSDDDSAALRSLHEVLQIGGYGSATENEVAALAKVVSVLDKRKEITR